jgi:alkanesulfonate monooxygenase SsuD/methylene tetrahydromethanopterin reductase-like flavin-dependent oxidoreductase (luciferase family)
MPQRNVVPKPLQRPHPPMWVACSNKKTIHLAARLGLGALAFTFLKPEEAKPWVDEYYEIFRNECVPIGQAVNPNILLVTGFGVHREKDVAVERFLDGIRFFQFALNHYYRAGTHRPGRTDLWAEFLERRSEVIEYDDDPVLGKNVGPSLGAIGNVEQVRARIRSFADIGIDQLVFIQQGGKNRHDHICESLELFAAEIMDEFHEGEAERTARKEEELAPYVEQAFRRKEDGRPLWMPEEEVEDIETIPITAKYGKTEAVLGSREA